MIKPTSKPLTAHTFTCISCNREYPDLRTVRKKINDPLCSDCAKAMYGLDITPHNPATCLAKGMYGRDCKHCTAWRKINVLKARKQPK